MPSIHGVSADNRFFSRAANLASGIIGLHAADVDEKGRFPSESMDALAAAGLWGLTLPTSVGGAGEGPRTFVAVVEEIATACASTAMVYVMHTAATQAIASSSTLVERDAILRSAATGKHLSTLAFSEKGSRSQFWAPVSKLEARDDGFVTSALKSWVTSATEASSWVASAQQPGAASPLESTVYLVRKGAEGAHISGSWNGLGLRGNDSAPATFDNLRVAAGDLISENGAGARTMLEVVLPWFAIGSAAMANGLCRAAVAATVAHVSSTTFEHTGGKLRDLPTLRERVARMSVRTEQARALTGYTAGEMESPSATTPLYVLESRMASLEAASDVTDLAMKACGGAAFSKHLAVERLFRDARAGWVMAPTVDHLADFIGKALTGLPLF